MKRYNKFWRIAKSLHKEQLQHTPAGDLSFKEDDLFHLDIGKRGGDLFLGFYSKAGIRLALEKYGIYKLLEKRGFSALQTEVDTSEPYKHRIIIYRETKNQKNLIIELVLRKQFINLNMPFNCELNGRHYSNLTIDWLKIQNPDGKFTVKRPQLPGQLYPGLGLGWAVLELLLIVCWRLKLAGLVNIPDHYHNAFIYSKVFYYLNPDVQAQFETLRRTFRDMPLNKISWGVEWGCVYDVNLNQTFKWLVNQQIIPIDQELKQVFNGNSYKNFVKERMRYYHFVFDESKYLECEKKYSKKQLEKYI